MSTPSLHPVSPGISAAPATAAAPSRSTCAANLRLRRAAAVWGCLAVAGQLVFAVYVAGFYGRAALAGTPERWNRVLAHGYVAGAPLFNAVLALHLLLAVGIVLAGAAQLLPALRRHAPAVHRWNGRVYMLCALALSLGGLAMIWVRGGTAGDTAQHLGTSLNALLILAFAAMAWRAARAGRIATHRRWALRLFLAVSGVWFFRIGLMFWLTLNQGPAGFDPDRFVGPALTALAFAQTLLPLAVLELYLRALDSRRRALHWLATGALALMSLVTAIGTAAATAGMWWPMLRPA
ncbi:putative membrane protein [Xanthomonas translucens]